MLLTVSPLKGSQKLSYRLESRMREIRLSGLEGGETQTNASSLPLSILFNGCPQPFSDKL
jgi:hypothetical protein